MSTPTKDDMRKSAERAVKAEGWRWMEGMGIWIGGSIVKRCVEVGARGPAYRDGYGRLTVVQFALPALDDPATLGCLLALVREAHSDPNASVYHVDGWWWVSLRGRPVELYPEGATEAEALVAALEAAP